MVRRPDFTVPIMVSTLMVSACGCSRDLPTSSAGVDAHAVAHTPALGAVGAATTTIVLTPDASGSVRHLPELGILEGASAASDMHSSYFRTTDVNREFRRGFAEFAIPGLADGFLAARIILTETRASISLPVPPDRHELSSYTDVDLFVDASDFNRSTSPLGTFETDANLPTQTFDFDATSLVARSQGARLGFRMKLEVDPTETGFRPLGTAFGRSTTPPGVTIEVSGVSAADAIEHLQDVIGGMDLPPGVGAALLGPLQQAVGLLRDGNPNNDGAVCGKLAAFLDAVDAKEQGGELGALQAADLRGAASSIATSLGCPEH